MTSTAVLAPLPDTVPTPRRQEVVAVGLLVLVAGACALVSTGATYTPSHRRAAALTSLLVVAAAAYGLHVLLLRFQSAAPVSADSSEARRRGLHGALLGVDGRASTSKAQVVLWSGAVLAALVDLLLLMRSLPAGASFAQALSQGWQADYLVLLGLPAAAATVASTAVSGSNNGVGPVDGQTARLALSPAPTSSPDGTVAAAMPLSGATPRVYVRELAPPRAGGVLWVLAELVTHDDRTVAWPDLQYVAFSGVALVFFVVSVLADPGAGLPRIPEALLTLMGVSASAYTANKVVETRGTVLRG